MQNFQRWVHQASQSLGVPVWFIYFLLCLIIGGLLSFIGPLLPFLVIAFVIISASKKNREGIKNDRKERRASHVHQQTAAREEDLPDLPKKQRSKSSRSSQMTEAYASRLDALKRCVQEMDRREKSVESFLDSFFSGSSISKSRYMRVMQDAKGVLEENYRKARQAVELFGADSKPTLDRIDILNNYVKDSNEIMQQVERVVDELIKVEQSTTLKNGDELDQALSELAETTRYYQH